MQRIEIPAGVPEDVVLLSHRAPVTFRRANGARSAKRGAGGLVTALSDLASQLDAVRWVCAASSAEDSAVAAEHDGEAVPVVLSGEPRIDGDAGADDPVVALRLIDVPAEQHDRFYGMVANPMLWFIQHGLYGGWSAPDLGDAEHEAFFDGYVPVNEAFADAVSDEVDAVGGRALVMLHDYHFYLVADRVRQRCPDALISQFIHIPWPGPDAWRVLPPAMRERLVRGLLGCDVVAFHTDGSARNFLLTVQELLGLRVDLDAMAVEVDGRTVRARGYPISIDVGGLRELAASAEVARRVDELSQTLVADDCQLILRVDRTDPSKNIVRGFRAFRLMLADHPELAGKVRFLALLQPSRLDVPEYAAYIASIGAEVAQINAQHDDLEYEPVDLRLIQDLPLAVAAYSICDVLMVNPVADGMNLVAKEAAVVNRNDAVLVLSENAGAHQELGDHAVTVYPYDIRQQADALYTALTMPLDERHDKLRTCAAIIERNDIAAWFSAQLADLAAVDHAPADA